MDQTTPETPENTLTHPHEVLVEWSAPTHPVHERSRRWYIGGVAAICGLIAFGILTGNWTLSLLAGLIGGMYFLVHREPPVVRHIAIGEHGFSYDGAFIHWDECVDFWVIRTPAYGELHIRKRKGFDRELVIQTGDIDQVLIRATISRFLRVRPDQRERLVDRIIRLCKL